MEGWMEGFEDFIWDVVRAWGFSPSYFLEAIVKYFSREVFQNFGVVGVSFLNNESVLVMPWVFADYTLA